MNPEKITAPARLCAHHRNIWKRAKLRSFHRLAAAYARICLNERSIRCTHHHESDR